MTLENKYLRGCEFVTACFSKSYFLRLNQHLGCRNLITKINYTVINVLHIFLK